MARVEDVVAFVLEQCGTMTTFKLHKLLYYAQGWSLAWDGHVLFEAKLKAYENGPCVGAIFNDHRGQRHVSRWPAGNVEGLSEDERDTVRAVLDLYGSKTADELIDMTHGERPWLEAWTGDRNVACEIPVESLRVFFSAEAERRRPASPSPEAHALAQRFAASLGKSECGDS